MEGIPGQHNSMGYKFKAAKNMQKCPSKLLQDPGALGYG